MNSLGTSTCKRRVGSLHLAHVSVVIRLRWMPTRSAVVFILAILNQTISYNKAMRTMSRQPLFSRGRVVLKRM